MSKRYINACIRIPMEVLPDGNYEPYPEYVKITFEPCDKLPSIDPLENNNLSAVLSSFINVGEYLPTELIPKHMVKPSVRTVTYNNTFKHRRGKMNRYSMKNRKTISLKIVDDLPNLPKQVPVELGLGDHINVNS